MPRKSIRALSLTSMARESALPPRAAAVHLVQSPAAPAFTAAESTAGGAAAVCSAGFAHAAIVRARPRPDRVRRTDMRSSDERVAAGDVWPKRLRWKGGGR